MATEQDRKRAEVEQIIKSNDEPSGVVVKAADGQLFFLTDEEARRTAIPSSLLYSAFLSVGHGHKNAPVPEDDCAPVKRWLDSHSPNSAKWRWLCLQYFELC
jgi:hypothetical protein